MTTVDGPVDLLAEPGTVTFTEPVTSQMATSTPYTPRLSLMANLAVDSAAANAGLSRIAAGGSPIPRNRLFFHYSFFDNVAMGSGGNSVNRFTPGFEKILDANGDLSFEARTEGESVTFTNPTDSLTVEVTLSGGAGQDDISIQGLDSLFDADLTIGGGGNDDIVFETNDTDIGTGSAVVRGREITINAGVATSGGDLRFQSTEEIVSTAAVSTGGGNITFNADTDQATTPGGSVVMNLASVTSGGGDIVIGGGTNPLTTATVATASAPELDGVYIHDTPINAGSGNISIRGSSALSEDGVDIGNGSQITTTSGTITIVGDATGTDDGIDIHGDSSITSTSGDISLTGTATGVSAEDGILIRNGSVTTSTGAITLTGTGADEDSGVELVTALIESTGPGASAITISGTSDTARFLEGGTIIDETTIRSLTAPILIDGSSNQQFGVAVTFDSVIESTGTGTDAATISIFGTGGLVGFLGLVSGITSIDGDITLEGTGGDSGGIVFEGMTVSSTGAAASSAATITVTGTAPDDDGVLLTDFETFPTLVTTVAGGISITGDASSGAGAADSGVVVDTLASVTSTGTNPNAGPISIMGTGDSQDGVLIAGQVSSVDGTIQIVGEATGGEEGVQVEGGQVTSTGTGTILITGEGNAATDNTGVRIDSFVTSNSGAVALNTPDGRILVDTDAAVTSTSGAISLTTVDSVSTGDDIELGAAASVMSGSGPLSFMAGDDVVMTTTSVISTSDTIEVVVDSGDADPGVGGNANLRGSVTGASLTGTGNADNDLISLVGTPAPFAGPATLTGNAGNDTLTGGNGADLIIGGADDDFLSGGLDDDRFLWNDDDGSDFVDGGQGDDRQIVNAGDLVGEGDDVTIADGLQLQTISRAAGTLLDSFTIDASEVETFEINLLAGPDTLDASGLNVSGMTTVSLIVDGGTEDDSIVGSGAGDSLSGGSGDDLIEGGRGDDTIGGGDDDDVFVWNNGDGSDIVDGNNGTDRQIVNATDLAGEGDQFTVSDNGARDLISRSSGTSIDAFSIDAATVEVFEFNLLAGADNLNASILTGVDLLVSGGSEDDTITGGAGSDTVSGDDGNDRVFAGSGSDSIDGGDGDDRLFGDQGDDSIAGGDDRSVLNGVAYTIGLSR
jgi:Ca2+-binding RTX toxin-like protein